MTEKETQDIVKLTIAISRNLNTTATNLSGIIEQQYDNGDITFDKYLNLHKTIVRPLFSRSSRITLQASIEITQDVSDKFTEIADATDALKTGLLQIKRAQKIINVAAGILVAVGLIASFVATPGIAAGVAAASSLASLNASIQEDVELGEESEG